MPCMRNAVVVFSRMLRVPFLRIAPVPPMMMTTTIVMTMMMMMMIAWNGAHLLILFYFFSFSVDNYEKTWFFNSKHRNMPPYIFSENQTHCRKTHTTQDTGHTTKYATQPTAVSEKKRKYFLFISFRLHFKSFSVFAVSTMFTFSHVNCGSECADSHTKIWEKKSLK